METYVVIQIDKLLFGPDQFDKCVKYIEDNHHVRRMPETGYLVLKNGVSIYRMDGVEVI